MSDVLGRVLRLIWHKRDTLRFLNYISWLDNKPTLWLKGRYEYDNKVIIILPHQCSVGVPVTWKIRCKIKATYCLEKESILRTVKEKIIATTILIYRVAHKNVPIFLWE